MYNSKQGLACTGLFGQDNVAVLAVTLSDGSIDLFDAECTNHLTCFHCSFKPDSTMNTIDCCLSSPTGCDRCGQGAVCQCLLRHVIAERERGRLHCFSQPTSLMMYRGRNKVRV